MPTVINISSINTIGRETASTPNPKKVHSGKHKTKNEDCMKDSSIGEYKCANRMAPDKP